MAEALHSCPFGRGAEEELIQPLSLDMRFFPLASEPSPNPAHPTLPVRAMCAFVFVLFSFCWLYYFQADILAVTQHGLSGGKTHYDRSFGAFISTAVLYLLHLIVFAFTRLSRRTHALTYLPSFLLLAFVCNVDVPFRWGAWIWAGPLVLVVWLVAVVLAKKILPFENDVKQPTGFFSRRMWLNMLQMAVMMLVVVSLSNTKAVDHFKARIETNLMEGRYVKALKVGARSHETDESLTMLRIFALAHQGELADRLFEYPVVGTSQDMLPFGGSRARLQLMSDSLLWAFFGVNPDSLDLSPKYTSKGVRGEVSLYLDSLECDSMANPAFHDYRLMGFLIDRQLDSFVRRLPSCYPLMADSLPRHYREALVLYQQRRDTLFDYNDSLMLLSWRQYHHFDSVYPRKSERLIRTEEQFRGTYWYYYSRAE